QRHPVHARALLLRRPRLGRGRDRHSQPTDRRATPAATPEVLDELRTINSSLAQAVSESDPGRIEDLEFSFHRVLNHLADANKLSWFLLNAIRYTPVHFYSADRGWGEAATATHSRLIDAMAAGDAAAAGRETRAHFTDGAKRLVAHLEKAGIWD
ncbi:FCD domain-containing protein, partial [Rhodococcus sp. NPDC059234]|uniref:FCD domain-containing protein n=1 Tax=Rhodococcus sp. NPDC059234 TaxID=3346781 RepID=UPI0036702A79